MVNFLVFPLLKFPKICQTGYNYFTLHVWYLALVFQENISLINNNYCYAGVKVIKCAKKGMNCQTTNTTLTFDLMCC